MNKGRHILNRGKKKLASALKKRSFSSEGIGLKVSFTFDDIHHTASREAREILNKHKVKGTFYCSEFFEGKEDGFEAADIENLVSDGHEIACHSHHHKKLYQTPFEDWKSGIESNRLYFFNKYGLQLEHFAYPGGQVSLKAKSFLSNQYSSLRGIEAGINTGDIDVLSLKANQLYGHRLSNTHSALLEQIQKFKNAWLIFYTHDVCEKPSEYGCTPSMLEELLDSCQMLNIKVSSVGEVFDQLCLKKTFRAP